ncbi:hypothetical protein IV102_03060 [bacterium]|nr:hypothetical protein [bacterium]
MKITTLPTPPAPRNSLHILKNDPPQPNDPNQKKDEVSISERFKQVTLGAACAAGGLTGGYVLGGMSGAVVSNLTSSAAFAAHGSAVGAGLGALWGTALYMRGNDDVVSGMVKSSAVGSLTGTVGLFAGANLGPAIANITGNSAYALNGALATALSGAVVGMAISRIGKEDTYSEVIKQVASASVGTTAGWMLGGVVEAGIRSIPAVGAAGPALGPVLGAVSGGLIGLALCLNRGRDFYDNDYRS